MIRTINRFIVLLLALIFGISEEVAAQYGIPVSQYKIRGKVKAEACNYSIPNIRVTLNKANDTLFRPVTAFTDKEGNYELTVLLSGMSYHPLEEKKDLQIVAEDIDGKENKGNFQAETEAVIFDPKQMRTTKDEDWDKSYEYIPPVDLQLKPMDVPPCDDKRK
jgi:putative lipoprotein (rSAM/lipoprotein system)